MTDNPLIDADLHGDAFLASVRSILGDKGTVIDTDDMAPWLSDWRGRYHGKARVLAQPADAHELAAMVRLCAKQGVPIVAQGGNSGMVGGAVPDDSGTAILLSTRRMNDIAIDADTMTATCGAGAILQVLHEAAEAHGLRFPLSLGGKGSATVGGLVSTNAGGTQVLRHGVMRALVQGLEVVLADGQVLNLTSNLKKDNRGFDLKQMFIGSEGTLGIVTRAVLKLSPAVAERRVVFVGLESAHRARELLVHCQKAMPAALEGFEIMPRQCLDAVVEYLPDARDPLGEGHNWYALLEFVADKHAAATLGDEVEALLMDALEKELCADAAIAANETQAESFWQLRESIAPAERARGPAMQHDISVPVERMPDFIIAVEKAILKRWPGHEVISFGHLGDGNVHLHVIAPSGSEREQWERETGKSISRFVYELVTAWGGSISAEHGIGQDKLQTLRDTHDPAALSVMRAIKRALDPAGLLNPGKLV
ncbi:FAD-binding oxidoreductase [Croceicoccus ponticola]|uniref:FAD-binding oxidoreductase n=1 Tax=Croceicoccus ponticola TaxID=2217664 RepID=A0A437GZW3_9SPHN|nr:FAD-binding oxidoreductase [Croceicoccus ponticola]RVQ68918.1 FAD-binding oxidoreductase [Croceicoccus ponticola]